MDEGTSGSAKNRSREPALLEVELSSPMKQGANTSKVTGAKM
jgi:hypothetical protein